MPPTAKKLGANPSAIGILIVIFPLDSYQITLWSTKQSRVKWFAQVHNTLAVTGLELATLRL